MKLADAFVQALKRGFSPVAALSFLPSYELQYRSRIPIVIYGAAEQLHWRFFALSQDDDHSPAIAGVYQATSDLEQLKRWARQRPRWALATGSESGVLVLEVNCEEGGQDSLIELCQDDWDWLGTLRSVAGTKRYIFFRWPHEQKRIQCNRQIGKGLRILGDGDWLLMPPSADSTGVQHAYANPQLEIAPTPLWLQHRALEKVNSVLPGAPQEARTHRVCMSFVYSNGWRCRFHVGDVCKVPISRAFLFQRKERLYEIVRRCRGFESQEAFDTLDKAVAVGRGQIWLDLNEAEFSRLKLSKRGGVAA